MRRHGHIRAEEALTTTLEGAPVLYTCCLQRARNTGAWITVQPSTVNGTNLGAHEWRDALFLRYGLEPPDLTTYCDVFQSKFLISHALDKKKCSLVMAHHNELCDGVADLSGKAFTPSHVRDKLIIYSGHAVKRTKFAPARKTATVGI